MQSIFNLLFVIIELYLSFIEYTGEHVPKCSLLFLFKKLETPELFLLENYIHIKKKKW